MDSFSAPNLIIDLILTIVSIIISYAIPFYIFNLIIFPRYWYSNSSKFIYFTALTFLYFWIYYWIEVKFIVPYLIQDQLFEGVSVIGLFMDAIFLFSLTMGFAFTFFINRTQINNLQNQLDKEKSLIIKEFIFLKNQLNSHTTNNFLNYCYSILKNETTNDAKAIELFSDMLKYTAYDKTENKIDLKREIDYIINFIELKRLLSSSLCIDFSYKPIPKGQKIIPRILITFIENAFKHGITNNPLYPVTIKLFLVKNVLNLNVLNHVSDKGTNARNSGTGIKNVKDQLNIFYSNKYELYISNIKDIYNVNLKLILN
jgi:LytS/YehU family sensor histidine kinase